MLLFARPAIHSSQFEEYAIVSWSNLRDFLLPGVNGGGKGGGAAGGEGLESCGSVAITGCDVGFDVVGFEVGLGVAGGGGAGPVPHWQVAA
jgi:hypothetical protein